MIISQEGKPSESLVQLLALTNEDVNNCKDISIENIVAMTQKNWLRKNGTEPWDIENTYDENITKQLYLYCKNMGLLDEYRPEKKSYDYVVFMGASAEDMILRCNYLKSLLKDGYTAQELVVLTGERPLDEKANEYSDLKNLYEHEKSIKTEVDAAQVLIPHYGLDTFFKMITWINAPMKKNEKTKVMMRPTTDDTIIEWLKYDIKPGSCLVISNQPYGLRQTLVMKSLLSNDFKIECSSCSCDIEELNVKVILDELARYIYQWHENSKKIKFQ